MKNSFMKKFVLIFCLLSSALPVFAKNRLNVMTFNIRLNTASDSANAWPHRKHFASSQIAFHEADIVGLQEAFIGQIQDLQTDLPGYAFVGKGRDDGQTKGEYSAILYNTARLELIATQTFWMSLTPNTAGSKGWDAAYPRIITWAKFKDKKTKQIFYAFNTHFDHMGQEARRESAKLVLRAVDSIAGKTAAIITGDFNAKPGDEPIKVITDAQNPVHLLDTKALSKTGHYGPDGTFNAFQSKEIANEPIDYIFLNKPQVVLKHATLSQSWQGRFSSDHFPVFAQIELQ
jgi:endonuclease/exonuclease/phosphatase family metal-dependent hydrolase